MNPAIPFGDLRAHAQATPSTSAWLELCALLERARPWRDPSRWRELELPYLQRALARWPGDLRLAPTRWLRALGEGDGEDRCAPALALATRLEVDGELSAWWATRDGQLGRWRALQSPHLASIRRLHAFGVRDLAVDDLFLHQLAAAPHLRALRALELPCCDLSPDACDAIASSSMWSSLRHLDLSLNPLGDEGVIRLARADSRSDLHALDLSCVTLGDDAAVSLASSSRLPRLHTLTLRGNHISSHGWSELARSPHVPFDPTPYTLAACEDRTRPDPSWSRALLSAATSDPLAGGSSWRRMCDEFAEIEPDPRWLDDSWVCLERASKGEVTYPRAATRALLERAVDHARSPLLERCDTLDLGALPPLDSSETNRALLERVLSHPCARNILHIKGNYVRWFDAAAALVIAEHAPPSVLTLDIWGGQIGDRFELARVSTFDTLARTATTAAATLALTP